MPRKSSDPIDILVGRNLRTLRLRKGMSQTELGQALGLTFQQVQKYEKGTNRVGAGRLYKTAAILGVPVSALFEGAPSSLREGRYQSPSALLSSRDALRMMEAFDKIGAPASRKLLVDIAEKLAEKD